MKVEVKKYDPSERPNLGTASTIVLKDGPRVRRVAKHLVVLDEHTGEYHHGSIAIKSYTLTRDACTYKPDRSITLTSDEAGLLADFIASVRQGAVPSKTGGFVLMRTSKPAEAEALARLHELGSSASVDALAVLLQQAFERPELLRSVLERVAEHGDMFLTQAATALNLFVYRKAVADLERLIGDETAKEVDFQRLLAEAEERSHLFLQVGKPPSPTGFTGRRATWVRLVWLS